jgi:hypothetical protein
MGHKKHSPSFAGMATGMLIGAGVALAVGSRSRDANRAVSALGDRLAEAVDIARAAAAEQRAVLAERHLGEHQELE